MDTHIDFGAICTLFDGARNDNRSFLFEYEVYDLIRFVGSETPPLCTFVPRNKRLERGDIDEFPGRKVVVKIVSPFILHKSDVGGVRIIDKSIEDVLSTVRRMNYDIPVHFAELVERGKFSLPEGLQGFQGKELEQAVSDSIEGVALCQYMHPDSLEFGNELLVSLRRTREFGMILSAGLGGTDTELYAERFRKGQAVVAASTEMVDGEKFFQLFRETISYKKLAGLTRGQKRIVTDEQLLECFSAFIEAGNYFSPLNPAAPYIIDELEINPFAFSNYLMLPLDGLCRFSQGEAPLSARPIKKIDSLLHPETIGIVGASSKGKNIGRIILENILKMGFPKKDITLFHPSAKNIEGMATTPGIAGIGSTLDLLILAVNGESIPLLVKEILEYDAARSVILIPGGLGGLEDQERLLDDLRQHIERVRAENDRAPVFLGGNSLGVLSRPGKYDSLFIPESKLPKKFGDYQRKSCLVSQSGAYMITRMSKLSFLDPAYAISIGNQLDLTAGDFLSFLKDINGLETIAFYMEGFADLDGLTFSKAVREALTSGKEIIFYKAGRTAEGKTAMSGHTASIAGDYMVCESCIEQAGAFVAETFTEFEGLLRLSRSLYNKTIKGNRLAAVSNAGYESVGIADNILGESYSLQLADFKYATTAEIENLIQVAGLESLVHVTNPLDVTPMATEKVYTGVIKALLEDDAVDIVLVAVVPLTPILHTLPEEHIADDSLDDSNGIVGRIVSLSDLSDKPIVMVVDSGPLYDHMANGLEEKGLAVFRSADQAVRVLGKYVQNRLTGKGK